MLPLPHTIFILLRSLSITHCHYIENTNMLQLRSKLEKLRHPQTTIDRFRRVVNKVRHVSLGNMLKQKSRLTVKMTNVQLTQK